MFKKILLCLVVLTTFARPLDDLLADKITKKMKTTTALIEFIKSGSRFRSTESIDIAMLIINSGSDINEKDIKGMTALMHASILGNENLVQLLLNKNADINIEDNNGMTALMYATKNNHIKIINLLFDKIIQD
jgi:ankyrin repeat protein